MERREDQPEGSPQRGIFKNMPPWERLTWTLIIVYILIVLIVFWLLGWKGLKFPLLVTPIPI
jgi:hypothetical protein